MSLLQICKEGSNGARMSGGSGVELARRSWSPLDPLVGRSEVEASQRILDPRAVGAPPQRSANAGLSRREAVGFVPLVLP